MTTGRWELFLLRLLLAAALMGAGLVAGLLVESAAR